MITLDAGKFQGSLKTWGCLLPLVKLVPRASWASRVFIVGDWRAKSVDSPRKEGSLGFLRIILKMIPNLIFGFPCMNSVPGSYQMLSCLSVSSHVIPSLAPRPWGKYHWPFPEATCNLQVLAWVPRLLCCLLYFSHYWVSFPSDCLPRLKSFSI